MLGDGVAAVVNKALQGPAKGRFNNASGVLDLNAPFELTVRVRRSDATPRTGYILVGTDATNTREDYSIIEGYGNGIEWTHNDLSVRATFGVLDGLFHTLLVTHDGTTLRTYMDGVLGEAIVCALPVSGTERLTIGGTQAADGTDTWLGDYDKYQVVRQVGGTGPLLPTVDWDFNDSLLDNVSGYAFVLAASPVYVPA